MAPQSKGIIGALGGPGRVIGICVSLVILFAIYVNIPSPENAAPSANVFLSDRELPIEEAGGAVPTKNQAPLVAAAEAEGGAVVIRKSSEDRLSDLEVGETVLTVDEATYELLNAFQRDDRSIEFTVVRSGDDDLVVPEVRLVTCAPFAVGKIAEGNSVRVDQPEMQRTVLGSPEATIAAYACGLFR